MKKAIDIHGIKLNPQAVRVLTRYHSLHGEGKSAGGAGKQYLYITPGSGRNLLFSIDKYSLYADVFRICLGFDYFAVYF